MNIKNISIENFRGFEKENFSLDSRMTVVIGNNTAGKTSLLKAIDIGLGAYLQCLKHIDNGQGIKCNFKKEDRFLKYSSKNKDYIPNENPPKISINADFTVTTTSGYEQQNIQWYREMTDKGSTLHNVQCAGQLMDVVADMEEKRWSSDEGKHAVYPLVLAFGTNRIDAQFSSYKKTKERQQRLEKAYRAALKSDATDFVSTMEWLNHYDKDVKDGKEFKGTREAFFEAMEAAIPAMSEIDVDKREIEALVKVNNKQPERHHYSYMSDGFKAMINIVSEIAYRAIMLNGYLGNEAIKETPGVVTIDEVDLYLHPHWQRHILTDLQVAFPKIQFIVTSHSPFIIQSVGAGQLLTLDDNVCSDGDPSMQSLEEIASTRMDMKDILRSRDYNDMVDKAEVFYNMVKSGKHSSEDIQKAKDELVKLEAKYSDNPAYIALLKAEGGSL